MMHFIALCGEGILDNRAQELGGKEFIPFFASQSVATVGGTGGPSG